MIVAAILFASWQCTTVLAATDTSLSGNNLPLNTIWLGTLDIDSMVQGWGSPHSDANVDGTPITLAGTVFAHGIGTHAESDYLVDLHGGAIRFRSVVGIDDDTGGKGAAVFEVIVDGFPKFSSAVLHGGDKPIAIDMDLTGAKKLELIVSEPGGDISFAHADWAGAQITLVPGGEIPTPYVIPVEPARLIIPPYNPAPAIHYPRITGATPGYPFQFMIPVTGAGPIKFWAKGLPPGLTLNSRTGIVTGWLKSAGTTVVNVTVKNAHGIAHSTLTIVGGVHDLARTPPMGWNSWNVWGGTVTDAEVRAAADAMISAGLASHGFEYVNIDDTWEAGRDANGNIQSNTKFPNMKTLADYIHAKGLKAGLYSSPGPATCAGYTASYQHEDQDARSYANWGFDYLKYDWCSYGGIAPNPDLAAYEKPYAVMRQSLDKVHRDILFSFCQYGMGDVWKWGGQIGGNCWRTTGDIRDSWSSLHSIYESQAGHEVYAGPGHWNDPDMLCVGVVGWGNTHPSRLTQNEQILHISMWSLLSAPLLIGCDMTKLDKFTQAILTNDEVLAIDQDSFGKPAGKIATAADGGEVWARPLADGTKAVGLINPTSGPLLVNVKWSQLGITGNRHVRDLWLHQDVGIFPTGYGAVVPTHGAILLKISK
jgi:alpha-galactosidase